MDKERLHSAIIDALNAAKNLAVNAANQARETATDKESIAENKYDTFGLEASYLAHGQAKRVAEYEQAISCYNEMGILNNPGSTIESGMLVLLEDESGSEQYLFLGPAAGGLKFRFDNIEITLITPASPLGQKLTGHCVADEIERQNKVYEIMAVY